MAGKKKQNMRQKPEPMAVLVQIYLGVGLSLLLLAACGAAVLWYCMQAFFGFSLVITAPLFWAVWALAEKEIKHETQIRRA